jgi:AraC-like DNA-binding protein
MNPLTGVSVHFVAALLEGLDRRRIDPAPLLANCGIDPALLADPAARVSTSAYAALMLAVANALDDEFFGRDSRRMKVGSFAMLCVSVIQCRTLQQALARGLRFYSLLLDDIGGALEARDGRLHVALQCKGRADLFAHENLLLFLHRLACWLVNRRIPVDELRFAFPRPERAEEYKLIFGRDAEFDAEQSGLAFDARFGALPVVRDQSALREFLALAPESLFVRYRPSHGTAHRVRLLLSGMKLADWPGFSQLARSLGMSASTLHRRLAAEDSNYQAIKDQIRRDRAMALLRLRNRSIMAIAEELGFAEASAFHRAFRKWCGMAPGQYRRSI